MMTDIPGGVGLKIGEETVGILEVTMGIGESTVATATIATEDTVEI